VTHIKKYTTLILGNLFIFTLGLLIHEAGHLLFCSLSGGSFSQFAYGIDEHNQVYLGVIMKSPNRLFVYAGGPICQLLFIKFINSKHSAWTYLGFAHLCFYFLTDLFLFHNGDLWRILQYGGIVL